MTNWRRAAAILVTVGLASCGGGDGTAEMVGDALAAADLDSVVVRSEGNAVRLTGTVDTLADRSRAVELASAIAGSSTQVRNGIAVTGLGPPERDEAGDSPSAGAAR